MKQLDSQKFRSYAMISALALQLVTNIVIGIFVGMWLDKKWGTTPFLLLICILLFGSVGMIMFIRGVSRFKNGK
ncbi:MAG: AtpZ/AtpI family protein [Deltaproteobacteria bacterium]|nr:AtpZ/AtpI family protein [Deltaproteobacteria bacterium]